MNLFYQFKADASGAYRNCISDVNVSIVSLIKSQVIHLTWRLLDQCSTCSGLIPMNKTTVNPYRKRQVLQAEARTGSRKAAWRCLKAWDIEKLSEAGGDSPHAVVLVFFFSFEELRFLAEEEKGGCVALSQSHRVI